MTRLVAAISETGPDVPGLTCPEQSAVNDVGATLALGDDCSLTLYAPTQEASSTTTEALSASLAARQNRCLKTSTVERISTVRLQQTVTTTVLETTTAEGFTCLPMAVTNSFGDELSLDEECKVEFKPGEGGAVPSSAQSSQLSSGHSDGRRDLRPAWVWGLSAFLSILCVV